MLVESDFCPKNNSDGAVDQKKVKKKILNNHRNAIVISVKYSAKKKVKNKVFRNLFNL